MLEIGHVVNVGTTALILETGSDIMAVLYFPDKARNIQLGTTVQIAPATVKKEEYGTPDRNGDIRFGVSSYRAGHDAYSRKSNACSSVNI